MFSCKSEYHQHVNGLYDPSLIVRQIPLDTVERLYSSSLGPKTYKLLSTLVAPRKPVELKYELLTATLEKHFCPQPPLAVWRFKFHTRQWQIGESVAAYVAELRSLARYCECKDSEDMLRDRLVCMQS